MRGALLLLAALVPAGAILIANGLYGQLLKRLEAAHASMWRDLGSPRYASLCVGPARATLRALFGGAFAGLSAETARLARHTRLSIIVAGVALLFGLALLALVPWLNA